MTVEIFSRDWIPLIQTLLGIAGIISLSLVWAQIRETRHWASVSLVHDSVDIDRLTKIDKDFYEQMNRLGINVGPDALPLSESEIDLIDKDDPAYKAVKVMLSDLEKLALGVYHSLYHEEYARELHGPRVLRYVSILDPFIQFRRTAQRDQEIFERVLWLANRWS